MPLDLGAPVMLGWTPLWMNLSRENSVLMQCGPPPMATNGVGSGTNDSGCIWSETAEDGRPMSRGRPSRHYARTTCCDRGYGGPSGRPRVPPVPSLSRGACHGEPCDVPASTPQVQVPRYRGMVARWHSHIHDLATASRA